MDCEIVRVSSTIHTDCRTQSLHWIEMMHSFDQKKSFETQSDIHWNVEHLNKNNAETDHWLSERQLCLPPGATL